MLPPDLPTWVTVIGFLGGVAAALLSIVTLVRKAVNGVKTASAWVADIVRHEVTEIVDARMAPLHAELRSNGGTSLKDQVGRVEGRFDDLDQRFDVLERRLSHVEHEVEDEG